MMENKKSQKIVINIDIFIKLIRSLDGISEIEIMNSVKPELNKN